MPEEKKVSGWRKRFLANRMTFESILFERELLVPERESYKAGLAGALGIALVSSLLLAQWVLRQGYFFGAADAAGFQAASACLDHFKSGGVWNLFRPLPGGFGGALTPPLYYLTYVPVLKFVTANLNWALILVNTFYLSGLALAVFIAVRKNRGNKSGWLGAGFAMAMPFVVETARRPDHGLATMALVAAVYACYINSEDFDLPVWNTWFGVFFGLGFFADGMFWIYMLPLAPFLLSGLSNNLAAGSILKGFIPGAVLAVPWYAFAAVSWALKHLSGAGGDVFRPGLWNYLVTLSSAAGLPLFLLGAAVLVWMYFSVFMPYSPRKIVAAWFWVPFIVVYFLPGADPELMYPALLPLAVAAAVMTPGKARKYLFCVCACLLAADQSGLLGPLYLGRARVAGGDRPARTEYRAPELLAAIRSGMTETRVYRAALAGADESFNLVSLGHFSAASGLPGLKFTAYPPGLLGLADFVVHKTPGPGASAPRGGDDARELSLPWFGRAFSRISEFGLSDGGKLTLYAKNLSAAEPLPVGRRRLANLELGGLRMEEAYLTLSGFDPARNVYAGAGLFSPYATLYGFDIYGLELEISGFTGFSDTGSASGLRITGASAVRVVSAKTTSYSFERFLSGKYADLEKLEVKLDKTARVSGTRKGTAIDWEFSLAANPRELALRLEDFTYGSFTLPGFMLDLFTARYPLSGLPCELRFNRVRLKDQMLEVS